jgi:hypothetical protein
MNRFARLSNGAATRIGIAPLIVTVAGLILTLASTARAQFAVQDLISIPRRGTELMKIDPATGQTTSSLTINLRDGADCADFRGGTGLALNPVTQELFALLNCGEDATRLLATIGLFTGDATIIGDTGDYFAGLAFSSDGTLFAVTGNGANVPNTLFTLSTQDATASPVCQLPQQPPFAGGQTIAFDPDKGLLFHASGNDQEGGTRIFESIDDVTPTDPLAPCPVTPHGPTGDAYREAEAMVFGGGDFFHLADLGDGEHSNLYLITSDGVVTLVGQMDHVSKGLAFVSGPAEVCYKVKKDDANGTKESVDVVDSIVGPRAVVLKLKKAFTICVPGGIRFATVSSSTAEPPGAHADSVVTGKVCYRVNKDDSGAEKKTDLQVEDESNGNRTVRIKTRKAFVVCDQALIDTNALP